MKVKLTDQLGYCLSKHYFFFYAHSQLARRFKEEVCKELGWSDQTFTRHMTYSRKARKSEEDAVFKIAFSLMHEMQVFTEQIIKERKDENTALNTLIIGYDKLNH